ncbi:hypothetical protein NDU88_006063 [Pleurodeles waltl]|uniref:Uncharacterized protein n=1 Tax=Pleurodeles waltl TaxID=8319 RepID=A0AAV7TCW3_PLEWA|nr:hypothetical protein NDU88_006063 [Pleurodeles waltl]
MLFPRRAGLKMIPSLPVLVFTGEHARVGDTDRDRHLIKSFPVDDLLPPGGPRSSPSPRRVGKLESRPGGGAQRDLEGLRPEISHDEMPRASETRRPRSGAELTGAHPETGVDSCPLSPPPLPSPADAETPRIPDREGPRSQLNPTAGTRDGAGGARREGWPWSRSQRGGAGAIRDGAHLRRSDPLLEQSRAQANGWRRRGPVALGDASTRGLALTDLPRIQTTNN